MADTKITDLTVKTPTAITDEIPINDVAGGNVDKSITVGYIVNLLHKKINGSSGAAGDYFTTQNLTADSADVTTTALSSSIMTTIGVGAGTWKYRYTVICQGASTTVGIGIGLNHTGTATSLQKMVYAPTTRTPAATGAMDNDSATAGGQMMEAKAEAVLNVITGAVWTGFGAVNTNVILILEGIIVVTVSGSLELKISSETGGTAVRVMADSCLELVKLE